MKAWLRLTLALGVLCLVMIVFEPAKAQCSQCAAQVATNSKNGGNAANGLNKGIYLLLAAPYLAVGFVGLIWYKKFRRKNVNLDIQNDKLHLN
ncbi:hypothetical protein [Mucilaginibacter sp.]|uniref:hypothetical protein n=1 Tax=Mucilaginibacter sp. TaxID=1882438 RepID=UPI002840CB98|nr:hypothetical protein [Mucilaginibacter sp.]MDR3693283.1 hypothetical protein [Mucilaginibacter sp.]